MTNQFSQIKWGRVLLTALVVYVLSFVAVFVIVTGYASILAFQARGAPDQAMIQAFANQYAPWIGPLILILFSFLGARHVARRVASAFALHGILLGALAGILSLVLDGFELSGILTLALTTAVGWLGAKK